DQEAPDASQGDRPAGPRGSRAGPDADPALAVLQQRERQGGAGARPRQADLRQTPGPGQARRGQGSGPSLETATVTGRRIVSPPANERGGHARPRGLFAPRPRRDGSDPATDAPAETFARPLESEPRPLDSDAH